MPDIIRLIFIGDIIGDPGFNLTKTLLPNYVSKYKLDFIIANAENITEGKGLLEKDGKKLLELGIHVLTGGNHTMDKIQAHKYLIETSNVLRPMNYPRGAYGHGFGVFKIPGTELKIAVVNLQGRVFMKGIDCPFRSFDWVYDRVKQETNLIFVDFHAEATAEKIAMGYFLDGKVTAVYGTHTHIQTADDRILKKGTGFINDVGMTGAHDGIIGMSIETVLPKFLTSLPSRFEVATENDAREVLFGPTFLTSGSLPTLPIKIT